MKRQHTKHEGRRERRARQQREALSRRAELHGPKKVPARGVPSGVVRATTRGLVVDWATFRHADFGQVCQVLGLRSPAKAA